MAGRGENISYRRYSLLPINYMGACHSQESLFIIDPKVDTVLNLIRKVGVRPISMPRVELIDLV
jgi:hypothetical protein